MLAGGWLLLNLGFRELYLPVSIAFALLYQPLYANLSFGQGYIVVFALLVVAWCAYSTGSDRLLGFALGLMLVLKLAGLLLIPLLILQRRWRALIVTFLTAIGIAVAALPWLSLTAWQAYINMALQLSAEPGRSVTAYQTLLGFVRHFLLFDSQWNPGPVANVPLVATWLPWVGFVVILAASLYAAYKTSRRQLAFVMFGTAGVILSPLSLDYHYVILLVPFAILVAWARDHSSWVLWIALIIAMVLIASDLPYRSPRFAAGWLALLAYPKLYGALLLWATAVWQALVTRGNLRTRTQPHAAVNTD
jgi:hypothetical protein